MQNVQGPGPVHASALLGTGMVTSDVKTTMLINFVARDTPHTIAMTDDFSEKPSCVQKEKRYCPDLYHRYAQE